MSGLHSEARKTVLRVGIGETSTVRMPFSKSRRGEQMASGIVGTVPYASRNVGMRPGGAWMLQCGIYSIWEATVSTQPLETVDSSEVDLAGGWAAIPMHRTDSDLTGIGENADALPTGVPAFRRKVAANASWNTSLSGDAASFPPPPDFEESLFPLDRVLAGKIAYPSNTPFAVTFHAPRNWTGSGALFRLYLGGPTSVTPSWARGGQHCVTVFGDGKARLWELGPTGWETRMQYQWGQSGRTQDSVTTLWAEPYGKNNFALRAAQRAPSTFLHPVGAATYRDIEAFHDTAVNSGHEHVRFSTGPGPVRLDVARNTRGPWGIYRGLYATSGTLVDDAIAFGTLVPINSIITITPDTYTPPGTAVAVQLYDAATHAPLIAGASAGTFLASGGLAVYPVFTLSSETEIATPILWGWDLTIDGLTQTITTSPLVCDEVAAASISGTDVEPGLETALCVINDLKDRLDSTFRRRDLTRCAIDIVTTDSDVVVSRLFEGRSIEPEAQLQGKPTFTFPTEDWRDFPSARFVSLWTDIAEKEFFGVRSLAKDPNAPHDPITGQQLDVPPTVTGIIRALMLYAGVPADEIDMTDRDLRLWDRESGFSLNTLNLQPGMHYDQLVIYLARLFLGAVVIRDHNAGIGHTRGVWSVLELPQWPYEGAGNFLLDVHLTPPAGLAGKLVSSADSYDAGHTYAFEGSFREWPRAPEINDLKVTGLLPPGASLTGATNRSPLIIGWARNEGSISDPSNVDYINKVRPYRRPVDPFLTTPDAVALVARRIMANAGHTQKWFKFEAPLALVVDPLSSIQFRPRPLRIGDFIRIEGYSAMVRSCSIWIESDQIQKMIVQGIFLDPTINVLH